MYGAPHQLQPLVRCYPALSKYHQQPPATLRATKIPPLETQNRYNFISAPDGDACDLSGFALLGTGRRSGKARWGWVWLLGAASGAGGMGWINGFLQHHDHGAGLISQVDRREYTRGGGTNTQSSSSRTVFIGVRTLPEEVKSEGE
ncbi:hypothetical protein DFP73DRAFT_598698 [Morchella snyderi]|nr:hypothetical protein DFP73DRAFT_598698 [Morchella snyderi]